MSDRIFKAAKARVLNRGVAPDSFLNELVDWGRTAPDEIFAPNSVALDIYAVIKPYLATNPGIGAGGPRWTSLLERKAALLETMRVHAGMESSWNWNEGVDRTNKTSMANISGQETGIFQVSFDSLNLDKGHSLKDCLAGKIITGPQTFIDAMKKDHALALEYYARLSRISIRWAGPLLRHGQDSVYPWLSRASVAEFQGFLKN